MLTRIVCLLLVFSVAIAQNCQNGGTPLNGTSCLCPAYVGGQNCETVKCQRWGIPDKNRCACAPGWYDNYCGIRGCRPPNEDNLDHSKRSVIIVFNLKKSMLEQLRSLRNNLKSMVGGITKSWNNGNQTENWIENFIVYGFVQVNQTMITSQLISENTDDVVKYLETLEQKLYDGDATQSVLTAVKNSQQLFPQMKSHAIVLVFTDSPATEATPWSHRFEERNMEQLCLQISFLWRSKVSFILSLPSGTNTSSDGIDVYRRLSMSTHGDYFIVKNSTETSDVLNNVVSTFFFYENVAVGFKMSSDVVVVPTADNLSDWVFTLITKDSSDYLFPKVYGTMLVAQGSNYMLVAGRNMTVVSISASKDPFNYRTYLQSKNTLLFDYNSDMTIDVGNGIVHLGVTMYSTIRTFGFPAYRNMTYHVMQNGKLVREQYVAYKRPQEECTFEMAFLPWVNTVECPPGPITQVHVLNYDGFYKSRVTPGYCDEIAHYTPQQQGYMAPVPAIPTTTLTRRRRDVAPTESCSKKNNNAIDDPRLKKANQFVFVLELHIGNQNIYKTLANEMDQILFLMDSNNSLEYTKEFSLIVNDDQSSRVLLSNYNRDVFSKKFRLLVAGLKLQKLEKPAGLQSVVQVMKSNIRPTAQVYYFTNQAVKAMQNETKSWDIVNRDNEFNFFTIADNVTTEIFALPSQLELVQKMSNGRIIPLEGTETTLTNIFADMINMHSLTTDSQKYDCVSAPFSLNTFIEKGARSTVFQFVGTGLNGITMTDAAGKNVSLNEETHFANKNFRSVMIDMTKYTAGTWKVSVATTRGGCQISVRHQSTTGVIYGFTNNSTSDFVTSQIPLQRSAAVQREQIYVPIRIQQRDNPVKIATTSLEIQIVNRQRYDQPVSHSNVTVHERDSNTCSYNYITPKVSVPQNELTSWTLTSYDEANNLILRRVFYYYQHFPAETSVCHGGQVDAYGQCICPERYTGEYCWDRVCAPGATLSYGICSCSSGFYGDFCELELMMPNATTVASPNTTANPLQTTTKFSSSLLTSFHILISILIVLLL